MDRKEVLERVRRIYEQDCDKACITIDEEFDKDCDALEMAYKSLRAWDDLIEACQEYALNVDVFGIPSEVVLMDTIKSNIRENLGSGFLEEVEGC